MKVKDFNILLKDLKQRIEDKRLNYFHYGSNYFLTDDDAKLSRGLEVTINLDSMSVEHFERYNLTHRSYQDSKTISKNYYHVTDKQKTIINELFYQKHSNR